MYIHMNIYIYSMAYGRYVGSEVRTYEAAQGDDEAHRHGKLEEDAEHPRLRGDFRAERPLPA